MAKNPLGLQPAFVSGRRAPSLADLSQVGRISNTKKLLRSIWVDHPPQLAIIYRLMEYRLETLGALGTPIDGRGLSQKSQAGKSAIAWRLKAILEEQRVAAGLKPNPYQVLIVTMKQGMTIKDFLKAVLIQMKDEFIEEREDQRRPKDSTSRRLGKNDRRTLEDLETAIAEWVPKLGVELLIVEEVQRLVGGRQDAKRVIEQFQTMLDRGVVPLVMMGTEDAEELFKSNKDLRPRLGTLLQLLPVTGTDDESAELLQDFCRGFDDQMIAKGIFKLSSHLDDPETAEKLSKVTGGHIGRVARLFKEAAVGAVERGAEFIESFDLSNATRNYAIANDWTDEDPFSIQP